MEHLPFVLALFGSLSLIALWARKPRSKDIRTTLVINKGSGPMAVRRSSGSGNSDFWAQYESPTFVRRGLSLQPTVPVPTPTKKRKIKDKPSFAPADQAELASLLAHYQQQGSFEVVA